MSNRDDLLDGARSCLYEKGYARTTARDIATAAGVSLAAIGYHFGSKEALLHAALRRETETWAARSHQAGAGLSPAASTGESSRQWALRFELLALLCREPGLRESFEPFVSAAALRDAIRAVAERLGMAEPRPGKRQYVLMLCSDGDSDMDTGCGTWSQDMQEADVWRAAVGLDPEAEGRTVRVREGQVLLGDGPFAETKDVIGGFTVIECADLDEAAAIAAKHPFAEEGQIEIRPTWTGDVDSGGVAASPHRQHIP